MLRTLYCALLLAVLLTPSFVVAVDSGMPVEQQPAVESSLGRFTKTLFALAVVSSLAVLVIGILGRGARRGQTSSDSVVRIAQRLPLDRANQLLVLACRDGQELLVASGPEGVTLLGAIEPVSRVKVRAPEIADPLKRVG